MKTQNIITSLLLAIGVFSCTEPFTPELSSTYTRLVVHAQITTDTMAHEVSLFRSADCYDTASPEPVTGAKISITDGINLYELTENPQKPGYYYTAPNVYGVPNKTYTLKIDSVDIDKNGKKETYNATSILYPVNPIDSIILEYKKEHRNEGYNVNCYATDPKNVANYYMFNLRINDTLYSDTIGIKFFVDDVIYDGSNTNGITLYKIIKERPKDNDFKQGMVLYPRGLKKGDKITTEIAGISKDYYTFLNEATLQTFGSNPMFSGPPANVFTNIQPKELAVGIFTAHSIKRCTVIFK